MPACDMGRERNLGWKVGGAFKWDLSRPISPGFNRPYIGNGVLGMVTLQLKAVGLLAFVDPEDCVDDRVSLMEFLS